MRSSTFHVPAVERPLIVFVDTVACLAFVTTLLSIVHTVPLPESVISPLSPSVRAGITRFPDQSTVTPLIVFMLVPETRVSCFPAIALASSLSALRVVKFAFIFPKDAGLSVSHGIIVESVDILWYYSSC